MSGDENVATIRRAYELWNRGEWESFEEVFHPEIVYMTSGVFPGFPSEYRGREGMLRFSQTMLEAWERFDLEPLAIDAEGDQAVVRLHFMAVGRASGVNVTVEFHHACRFRDGLVFRLGAHSDRERAMEAAGLGDESPPPRVERRGAQ